MAVRQTSTDLDLGIIARTFVEQGRIFSNQDELRQQVLSWVQSGASASRKVVIDRDRGTLYPSQIPDEFCERLIVIEDDLSLHLIQPQEWTGQQVVADLSLSCSGYLFEEAISVATNFDVVRQRNGRVIKTGHPGTLHGLHVTVEGTVAEFKRTDTTRGIDRLELDAETFAQALRDWIQTYEETPA
jgi:hypothetical protein